MNNTVPEIEKLGVSPRAAGPAGARFETCVGAHYALSLLMREAPRGFENLEVESIEFQSADFGHPFDDVIVSGSLPDASLAILEVQAKRSLKFTKSDSTFEGLVRDMIEGIASGKCNRFAVAIERTREPTERGAMEVLELARQTPDLASFSKRLSLAGRSNASMRTFHAAFVAHANAAGVSEDVEIHKLLKSFLILHFDYARPGSAQEHFDAITSARLFQGMPGAALGELRDVVMACDAAGGVHDSTSLLKRLSERGLVYHDQPDMRLSYIRLREIQSAIFASIDRDLGGVQLPRDTLSAAIDIAMNNAELEIGVVAITGSGGVGKSSTLISALERRISEKPTIVLSPLRTTSGGGAAWVSGLDPTVSLKNVMESVAFGGAPLLVIDAVDRFENPAERTTVEDLVQAAVEHGYGIVFSARDGWEAALPQLYNHATCEIFKTANSVPVPPLAREERGLLGIMRPELQPFLANIDDNHPAAKNLFHLKALLRAGSRSKLPSTGTNSTILSTIDLARDWFSSGGHSSDDAAVRLARRRVLAAMGEAKLTGVFPYASRAEDPLALTSLISDDCVQEVSTDKLVFGHDVMADWAVASVLCEQAEPLLLLPLTNPPSPSLVDAFVLYVTYVAKKEGIAEYRLLLESLKENGVDVGWFDLALLALVRSEVAAELLITHTQTLLDMQGVAERLIRRVTSAHGAFIPPLIADSDDSLAELLDRKLSPEQLTEIKKIMSFPMPADQVWSKVILWCTENLHLLSNGALKAAMPLFQNWLVLTVLGEKSIGPQILNRLSDMLVDDIERDALGWREAKEKGYPHFSSNYDILSLARQLVSTFSIQCPAAATAWLKSVANARSAHASASVLRHYGHLPSAVSEDMIAVVRAGANACVERRNDEKCRERTSAPPFGQIDTEFLCHIQGLGFWLKLLQTNFSGTLVLIRDLVDLEINGLQDASEQDVLELTFNNRIVSVDLRSYSWARGNSRSYTLQMAFPALEQVCHERIESGETLEIILTGLIGVDDQISGAFIALIADFILCYGKMDSPILHELLGSPAILREDRHRFHNDQLHGFNATFRLNDLTENDREILNSLGQRPSRKVSLEYGFGRILFNSNTEIIDILKSKLESAPNYTPWSGNSPDWDSLDFWVWHGLRMLDVDSYKVAPENNGFIYEFPDFMESNRALLARQADEQLENTLNISRFRRCLSDPSVVDDGSRSESAIRILTQTNDVPPVDLSGYDNDRHNSPWIRRICAAGYIERFGELEAIATHRDILDSVFHDTLSITSGRSSGTSDSIDFDPVALVMAGRLYRVARGAASANVQEWLNTARQHPRSVANVLVAHSDTVDCLSEPLRISLIRMGLEASTGVHRFNSRKNPEIIELRQSSHKKRLSTRQDAETTWLEKQGPDTNWPLPPSLGNTEQNNEESIEIIDVTYCDNHFYVDWETAAKWLDVFPTLKSPTDAVGNYVQELGPWLRSANLTGQDRSRSSSGQRTNLWQNALFYYIGTYLCDWAEPVRESLIFELVKDIQDGIDPDTLGAFIRGVDMAVLRTGTSNDGLPSRVRSMLWPGLKGSQIWKSHILRPTGSISFELRSLLFTWVLWHQTGLRDVQSYAPDFPVDTAKDLLEPLMQMAENCGGCPLVADGVLSLVGQLDLDGALSFLPVATEWARTQPPEFWTRRNIGKNTLDSLLLLEGEHALFNPCLEVARAISMAGLVEAEALVRRLEYSA